MNLFPNFREVKEFKFWTGTGIGKYIVVVRKDGVGGVHLVYKPNIIEALLGITWDGKVNKKVQYLKNYEIDDSKRVIDNIKV